MLWLVLAATVLFLGLAARPAPSNSGRLRYVVPIAALVGVVLAFRFGPRMLAVVGPTIGWLAWSWLKGRASSGEATPPRGAPARAAMTREEALRVLGLKEGASRAEIIHAHRSLIKKVHPDHGGSDLLAQQVNEARRVLQSDV